MEIEKNKSIEDFFKEYHLSVSYCGYVRTGSDWHQTELQMPWSRLYYVLDGEGFFVADGQEIPIEPGYVYFAPCGVTYGFYSNSTLEKLFFHVNIIKADGYDLFNTPEARIMRFEYKREKVLDNIELFRSTDPIKQMLLKAELWKTVAKFSSAMLGEDCVKNSYSPQVAAAMSYIRANLSASLKTGDVSAGIFCSPSCLNDHFKRDVGVTVAKYIDDLLMFEARRRLASENESVGETSNALGYCDQFYFSRCFAKKFGMSPRDYKKLRSES